MYTYFVKSGISFARLGVVLSMYILTLWFLPSFAHYFKKLSAALDSKRINLNSVEENLTFNAEFLCPCTAWRGSEHVHPNFMTLTIFRPLFYETFSSFGQHKNQFEQCWKNITFNVLYFVNARYFVSEHAHSTCMPRAGHGWLGVVPCMYILTLWFLPSFAHYFTNLSAALDSIRINLNSVEENLTFNALFLSMHRLAWFFREHVHPNLGMILTIFRPLFYETFSSFGQQKNQFEQCWRKFNFQCTFLKSVFRMQFCCPGLAWFWACTS